MRNKGQNSDKSSKEVRGYGTDFPSSPLFASLGPLRVRTTERILLHHFVFSLKFAPLSLANFILSARCYM